MSEAFSRRIFLGNSLAVGGGLLLGSSLLSGCDGGTAPADSAALLSSTPVQGGRLRIGIIDGDQSGNLDAHKPVGGGIIRGWALYSKFWNGTATSARAWPWPSSPNPMPMPAPGPFASSLGWSSTTARALAPMTCCFRFCA